MLSYVLGHQKVRLCFDALIQLGLSDVKKISQHCKKHFTSKSKWEIVIDNVQALSSNVLVIASENHIENSKYPYPKIQESKNIIYTIALQAAHL